MRGLCSNQGSLTAVFPTDVLKALLSDTPGSLLLEVLHIKTDRTDKHDMVTGMYYSAPPPPPPIPEIER